MASYDVGQIKSDAKVTTFDVGDRRTMANYKGEVKWFNNSKGYGFLGHEGGPDVFAHYSAIQLDGYKTLKEGDPVEFDIIEGEKGRPQADKIRLLQKT